MLAAWCRARRAVLLLALLAGCGSAPRDELPPAASRPPRRRPTAKPAGRLVPIGFKPEGAVADPRTGLVAVGLRAPDELALVNGATGSGRAPRAAARRAAPSRARRAGGPVLVPAEDADALLQVGLPGGEVTRARTGREPHDAAAAGDRVFVADEFAHRLTVLEDGRPVSTIETALQPGGVTPLDNGRQVAVVSVRERVVETFDAESGERTGRAPAGVGPTHAVSDGGNYLFVTDTDGRRAARLPPAPAARADPPLPAARLAVRDRDRHPPPPPVRLPDRAQPADGAGRRRPPEPRAPLRDAAQQPNAVAVDEASGRVFVTGKVDGVLQLLDPGRERTR